MIDDAAPVAADIELDADHWLQWVAFKPERVNGTYADIPDDDHAGCNVYHRTSTGDMCMGYIALNRRVNTGDACWDVVSWDPLTLKQSIKCRACGDHGYIRDGKWEATA